MFDIYKFEFDFISDKYTSKVNNDFKFFFLKRNQFLI